MYKFIVEPSCRLALDTVDSTIPAEYDSSCMNVLYIFVVKPVEVKRARLFIKYKFVLCNVPTDVDTLDKVFEFEPVTEEVIVEEAVYKLLLIVALFDKTKT